MGILKVVLTYVLWIYLLFLIGRMIFSWIQMFARQWVPTGILLVVAESIYTVTDPPLKFLRRYIPPPPPRYSSHGSELHGGVHCGVDRDASCVAA